MSFRGADGKMQTYFSDGYQTYTQFVEEAEEKFRVKEDEWLAK